MIHDLRRRTDFFQEFPTEWVGRKAPLPRVGVREENKKESEEEGAEWINDLVNEAKRKVEIRKRLST
jgi:hypothetical protein